MKTHTHFFSRWQNLFALAIIAVFVFVAIAAPHLAPPENPEDVSAFRLASDPSGMKPHPPSKDAPLGTVPTGAINGQIDILYTLIWGTRSALIFGLLVTLISATTGVLIGALSGYLGTWVNNLVMRITDAMLAFPLIAAIVLFQQLLLLSYKASGALIFFGQIYTQGSPPTSLQIFLTWIDPVMLAFILFSWMPYARVMNAVVLLNKDREFIQAAKALGAGHSRILIHHLIPNSISPSVVLAAKDVGGMVLLQATFTFIGMGGKSDWGNLLVIGRRWIIGPGGNPLTYWWVFIPATLALVLFGIGWNLLGDGFNDWLNPRTSQSG